MVLSDLSANCDRIENVPPGMKKANKEVTESMRARTWVAFILTNIIVSAMVMLTVLFVWERIKATPTLVPESALLTTEGAPPAPTAVVVLSPTPAQPAQYAVQEGDTLSDIAQAYGVSVEALMAANGIDNPNLLQVGQTLVVPLPTMVPSTETLPEPTSSVEPLLTPLPTLTPSGPSMVEIGQVLNPDDLSAEVVVVRSLGGSTSLEGWTLSDAEDNVFTFPTITLFADAQIRVYSKPGRSTPSDLYWGREMPAWTTGELVTLRDGTGTAVDTYIVP